MSGKIFDVFDKYSYLCKKRKFMLAGDRDWTWFKIYVFSMEDVDLVEELNKLNSLLSVTICMSMVNFQSVLIIRFCLTQLLLYYRKRKKRNKK